MEGTRQLSLVARVVAGLMLLFAIGDLTYSYYQILRIVICGASIFLTWYFIHAKIELLGWMFIVRANLFNPVFPIYMEKSTWQILDLLFGIMFLGSLAAYNQEKSQIK